MVNIISPFFPVYGTQTLMLWLDFKKPEEYLCPKFWFSNYRQKGLLRMVQFIVNKFLFIFHYLKICQKNKNKVRSHHHLNSNLHLNEATKLLSQVAGPKVHI